MTSRAPVLLIGWELGAGSGHVVRLIPIVDLYLKSGWHVVAAVRNVSLAKTLFSDLGDHAHGRLRIVQAPIFLHRAPEAPPPTFFADILARIGFAELDLLKPVVRAWLELIKNIKPDIILSDSAPSLNIAAFERVPVITLGNGWSTPPDKTPLPPFFSEAEADGMSFLSEERIVEAARKVCAGSTKAPERLSAILRGVKNFVCTLPLLDPYRSHRERELYWPVEIPPVIKTSGMHKRSGVVVYLPKGHPGISTVLRAATLTDRHFLAYLGGISYASSPNFEVQVKPIRFAEILPTAQFAIHHGGLGTATWCLLHRIPQLICCTDLEKLLIARAIAGEGCGMIFSPSSPSVTLKDSFERLADVSVSEPDLDDLLTRSGQGTVSILLRASTELMS